MKTLMDSSGFARKLIFSIPSISFNQKKSSNSNNFNLQNFNNSNNNQNN